MAGKSAGPAGSRLTIMLMMKRDGSIFGKPRITFSHLEGDKECPTGLRRRRRTRGRGVPAVSDHAVAGRRDRRPSVRHQSRPAEGRAKDLSASDRRRWSNSNLTPYLAESHWNPARSSRVYPPTSFKGDFHVLIGHWPQGRRHASGKQHAPTNPSRAPTTPERNDRIREMAYFLWLDEGCPEGGAERHWAAAEAFLIESEPEERKRIEGEPPGEPAVDSSTARSVRRARAV